MHKTKANCRKFSFIQDLQQADQLDPVNSSATFGNPYRYQLELSKPCKIFLKVISTQKQPGCKIGVALFEMASMKKKAVKSMGVAKKWL